MGSASLSQDSVSEEIRGGEGNTMNAIVNAIAYSSYAD